MVRRAGAPALRQGASASTTSARKAATTRRRRGLVLVPANLPAHSPVRSAPESQPPSPVGLTRPDTIFETLAESERHFRTLIEQAADGIVVVDSHGRIALANSRAREISGYGPDEILGLEWLDTYPPEDRELGLRHLNRMSAGATLRFERLLRRKDGTSIPIEVGLAWLPDGESQSIMRDISDRHRVEDELRLVAERLERRVAQRTAEFERAHAELEAANAEIGAANAELQQLLREQERLQAELAYRAMHDPLTGLANRILFGERLDHALRVGERGVAVVWIDLDDFKEINDIFGHDVGDEMLVAVSDRLREVVRESDDIARMGGDEFAVILPNVVELEAQMVAERILCALSDKDAFRLQIGASIGCAWQRPGGGDGPSLVRRADDAMYRAKTAGGGVAVTY